MTKSEKSFAVFQKREKKHKKTGFFPADCAKILAFRLLEFQAAFFGADPRQRRSAIARLDLPEPEFGTRANIAHLPAWETGLPAAGGREGGVRPDSW